VVQPGDVGSDSRSQTAARRNSELENPYEQEGTDQEEQDVDGWRRRRKLTWVKLIQKVYEIDPLLCRFCGTGFRGRNAIHHPPVGKRTRMQVVLAYNSRPGIAISESAGTTFYSQVMSKSRNGARSVISTRFSEERGLKRSRSKCFQKKGVASQSSFWTGRNTRFFT